jgi:hypothetical protein
MGVVSSDQLVDSLRELIEITSSFWPLTVVDCNEATAWELCDIRRFIGAPSEKPPKQLLVAEIKKDRPMTA